MKEFIHFTADWCNPCKNMKPVIEKFISENPDIDYTVVDVDTQTDLVNKYQVQTIPTFISKIDGKIHDRISGVASEFKLKSMFG
jgi:thiol-disulfide isomerase/thioredoxin